MHAVVQLTQNLLIAAGSSGWLTHFVNAVFDPAWNVENRATIWAVIVGLLFFSGVGLPFPEDIPLTLAGFTTFRAANEHFVLWHFVSAFVAVAIPILLGDILAYSLGRRFGFGLRDRIHILGRVITDKRLATVQRWFDNYGGFAIFMGRQVAGVRFVTFFTAGTMRVPLMRFVFFDFLGCLVSVPVWLTLGALASHYGEAWLQVAMRKVGGGFLLTSLFVITVFIVVVRLRTAARERATAAASQATTPAGGE